MNGVQSVAAGEATGHRPSGRSTVVGAAAAGHASGLRARGLVIVVGAVVAMVVALVAALRATPWPAALLIRRVFERGARATLAEMAPHVPSSGFVERRDIRYAPPNPGRAGRSGSARRVRGGDTTFDIVTPAPTAAGAEDGAENGAEDGAEHGAGAEAGVGAQASTEARPVVVWIHGGAWISGSKADVLPYLKLLAVRGYAAVGLDYTIAPEATYPTALTQLNEALRHLVDHADELGIDPRRIVLAGDSAGAQLASQLAVLTTDAAYAASLGIRPSLDAIQLAGVVLHCGLYDLAAMENATGIVGWGFKAALWAYTGDKHWSTTATGRSMSTLDVVTAAFPPAFVSGGNGDGLTAGQSKRLVDRLRALGADVTPLFWPADHVPSLPHEYQFHLDYGDAFVALDRTIEFLDRVTAAPVAVGALADGAPHSAEPDDGTE
ncbi:alpha/beta hydrolase [Herbiconiux daphne]|uniref:Alpha/beta hydrolase n=1 Tax=Herbiconiux daphne TaxID=2970914 RepID=A0ABT2GYP2_9MICO|nr:alpha/beta hydrolase [Herbiconiux daphne]MCS5733057.1 alpha/beta hydrolase [Herbiconiux daphne]